MRSTSNSEPVRFEPSPYVTCPDFPKVCSHPKGKCPADRAAEANGIASFKRIEAA